MAKEKKHRKKSKFKKKSLFRKKKKIIVISIVVILIILSIVFGTKIVLYVNFLLGNDIIVKLEVDKEVLSLVHGQEENITFKASVNTNPFCSAECNSKFEDISRGVTLEQDKFTLRPGLPLKKDYAIKPMGLGTGQQLYRFSMECQSSPTILCHTNEEPTMRSILVVVWYNLTEEEKILKGKLKEQLELLTQQLSEFNGKQVIFNEVINDLNKSLPIDYLELQISNLKNSVSSNIGQMQALHNIWKTQNYSLLAKEIEQINSEITKTKEQFIILNSSLSEIVLRYNILIDDLIKTREQLEQIHSIFLTNNTLALKINNLIKEFNELINLFQQKAAINNKENTVKDVVDKLKELSLSVEQQLKKETLRRELELDINYDALCQINGLCINHPTIKEHASQNVFELDKVCAATKELSKVYNDLNKSVQDSLIKYPDTNDFWNNIHLKIKNIKQNITNNYINRLPENGTNTELVKELLTQLPLEKTENYSEYNLTSALIFELIKQKPESCEKANFTLESVNKFSLNKIEINDSFPISIGIVFDEPLPQCCVFGKCRECCIAPECQNDPATFPIIFLHGHAVSEDVSAEYSLDGFNKIQKRLEEDGYLNAGAISLYTARDAPNGIWGISGVPVSIKTSYYFDVFKEQENYVVVQTKSENIDTYAIRLKELIDTIQYKTGKPKVNIIAFSMGGLVARRYLQIFGANNVEKLILIGVPNKGIVGDIANYCPMVGGEKRECRDMNANSLFINKLNREKLPNIPIYNIIGTGCKMDQGVGDGIVFQENAILEGAKNFIIEGKCKGFEPLHIKLLDIDAYPEAYYIINEALKD